MELKNDGEKMQTPVIETVAPGVTYKYNNEVVTNIEDKRVLGQTRYSRAEYEKIKNVKYHTLEQSEVKETIEEVSASKETSKTVT